MNRRKHRISRPNNEEKGLSDVKFSDLGDQFDLTEH